MQKPGASPPPFHRFRHLPLAALALLLPLSTPAAFAAGNERTDVAQMDPVVVTGTRTEKRLAESPVRVEVVGAEELSRTHARTLAEALENVPGLQLREVHGKSGQELSLQGLSSDQVLVLIDGLPVAASTGSTVDLAQYTLAEVERIEIVKGATSAQYGSAAMGGVINVITRRIEPGLSGALRAEVGSLDRQNDSGNRLDANTRYAQARIEGGSHSLRGRLAADVLENDGVRPDADGWARPGDATRRAQYAARLDWQPLAQGALWLDGNVYRQKDDSRFEFYAAPNRIPQLKIEDVQRERASGGGHWNFGGDARLELRALHERYRGDVRTYSAGDLVTDRQARLGQSHVGLQFDAPVRWRQAWTAGLDYRRETLEQSVNGASELARQGQVSRDSREAWLQNDLMLSPGLELLLGLRVQDDADFGDHAAPKLALRASLPAVGGWQPSLRAAYGQGYRVPNLKERHYLFDHSALGYQVIGNPDLQPEVSDSWQLGLNVSLDDRINAEVNVFLNNVRDLIQTDLENARIVDGIALYTYENVARARTMGAETALRWRLRPGLSINAAYTFTDTEDRDRGIELTRRPRHMTRLGVDWDPVVSTRVSLRLRQQSDELVDTDTGGRSPGWTTVDLKLGQDIGHGVELVLGLDNLLDRQRDFGDEQDFGPVVGRFFYLGATWRWSLPSAFRSSSAG